MAHLDIRPEFQAKPTAFDQFGRQLHDDACLHLVGRIAFLQQCALVRRSTSTLAEPFGKTTDSLRNPSEKSNTVVKPVAQRRIRWRGRERPQLDWSQRVNQELLVMRCLGAEDRKETERLPCAVPSGGAARSLLRPR